MPEIHTSFQDNARKCYTVHIGEIDLFFSYETLIGVHLVTEKMRVKNEWGPTTGRHINQLGIEDFPIAYPYEMEEAVYNKLQEIGLKTINKRMNP